MSYKPCVIKPITLPLLNQSALCGRWYGIAFHENLFDSICEEVMMIFSLQCNGDFTIRQSMKIKDHEIVKVGKLTLCKSFYNEPSKLTAEMQIEPKTCLCAKNIRTYTTEGKVLFKASSEPILSQRCSTDTCAPCVPKCMFCSIKDEFSFWIHWTDYKNFLIIGNPNAEFLYIMSREKCVTKYELDNLILYCQRLGYKANLIHTPFLIPFPT